MTKQQVKWASLHEWYLSHTTLETTGVMLVTVRDGDSPNKTRRFDSFYELYKWAGY